MTIGRPGQYYYPIVVYPLIKYNKESVVAFLIIISKWIGEVFINSLFGNIYSCPCHTVFGLFFDRHRHLFQYLCQQPIRRLLFKAGLCA
jgi:hypothetical protein